MFVVWERAYGHDKKIIKGMHVLLLIFPETKKFLSRRWRQKKTTEITGRSFTVHIQVLNSEAPGKSPFF